MRLLIVIFLFPVCLFGQISDVWIKDTVYQYSGTRQGISNVGVDLNYYPVAVIDSITGHNPDSLLTVYTRSTDADGDSTYTLKRFGYSTDSASTSITWLNTWSLADTITIPDAVVGKFPVVATIPKATTGGRTGREVYAWGDSVYSADMYNFYADTLFARMSATPTDSFKFAVNRLLTRLYVANVLDSADIYRVIAAPDTQVAKMNLVSRDFTATILGTESFTKYQGYTGNG
ncbi:MAG: hypothetical protein WC401_03520, partial [Bacteroidales bacterium]